MTDLVTEKNMDEQSGNKPPTPKVSKGGGLSLVWAIPILTGIVGIWLVFQTLAQIGPEITINFKTAEGIEAGKTKIKYKNIEIGIVEAVHFSNDFKNIIITAQMQKEAEKFLNRNTNFWVVRPSLSLRGATGLSTLVSGAYIEIEPGQGAPQTYFTALDNPPVVKAEVEGKEVILLADKLGSLDRGSPVYHHGMQVGEVMGHELGNDQRSVLIHAFIKSPYDELLQSNTNFWNVSGIDISISANGLNIHTESVESILFGGISFKTPVTVEEVSKEVDGLIFTLYKNYRSISEESYHKKVHFILYFPGSVKGLSINAPVEFKGIKIGSVKNVRLEYDAKTGEFQIPVIIAIEPERVVKHNSGEAVDPREMIEGMVADGLRASLQSNLVSGQAVVQLDMYPGTAAKLTGNNTTYTEIPTIFGDMEQIAASLKQTLKKSQITLDLINDLLEPDSPLQSKVMELAVEMNSTASSIRHFVDMLERNPNSVIFGKSPKKKKKGKR